MTTISLPEKHLRTVSDLLNQLGDVPTWRVLLHPAPGTATVEDLIDVRDPDRRTCELVDGTLVEKAMGYRESLLAGAVVALLRAFVIPRNLGLVSGEAGMMRLFAGLVRSPDVAYVSWDRVPGRRVPDKPVPDLVPNLAVEVLSESNTPREMDRKRREYFQSGVELVWIIDPDSRTVDVYTSPDAFVTKSGSDVLDGGSVLPGLVIPIVDVFAELDREAKPQS